LVTWLWLRAITQRRALYREVMAMLQAMSSTTRLRNLLMSFARLAAAEGQMEAVARLLGCFDALSQKRSG
jgi:hypothetical protein